MDPNAGAEAASAFVPMASEPPLANEGHVALAVSAPETEDARFSGDAAIFRARARRRAALNALGAVSRFAHPPSRPPPLLADEPATREAAGFETQKEEKGVAGVPRRARTDAVSSSSTSSSTPRAPLTARTYASGGGEDLVEAFSRSRHGRAKELDALFSRGVDPRARDANGLTLLHIAAQNNQRKTAKLVLKRTDYAVDPPSREILNQQTNAGQTALHYAFAYGYHDLARWLVSLGADDGVVNAHGLSCYEGLDPDEPAREALAAPEMLEMARRKRQERRAEARRPGTSVGTSRDGARRHDELDAPGWEPRGPRSDSAYGGSSNRSHDAYSHDAYSVSSAGSVESPTGWDPRPPSIAHRGVPAAPMPSPPVALVASPVVQDPFAVWDPGVLVRVRVPDTRAPRGSPRRDPASFRPRRSRTRTRRARTGAWSRAPTACTANFTGILCIRCILPTRTRRRRGTRWRRRVSPPRPRTGTARRRRRTETLRTETLRTETPGFSRRRGFEATSSRRRGPGPSPV